MSGAALTKRDQIVDELRRMIVSGEMPRGSRLPQDELAKRFNSSITPVREALRALEADALVVAEPHRGVRVAGVDFERVQATYVLRRLAESFAMRRAAIRLSPHELLQAESLLARLKESTARRDVTAMRSLNRDFHFYFYQRCGLPGLVQEIEGLWRVFPWDLLLDAPEPADISDTEHELILDAVRRSDPEAAADAMGAHLARSFLALAGRITGTDNSDPFEIHGL
ncbi:DNA-binding transcriptional regulator, GntR family [Arthrobacter subterraneus]|uniref:DNA-binding transcriptional regulator, GntR family n=2 Tax=Arthrobacter subterraneus TaxID=335973 RepID=A0A1G8HT45_9MICC|nr:DNA-binding transcriptional regulator, GntR family [Arthrobacter subterraneus]